MKIILTLNFAEEEAAKQTEQESQPSNIKDDKEPLKTGEEAQNSENKEPFSGGVDTIFGDWHVNPNDGAVTNKDRKAEDFFLNPNFTYRTSSSDQEEALFEPHISDPDLEVAKRRDVNNDGLYQKAMRIGRNTARAKALYDNEYVTSETARRLLEKSIRKDRGDYMIPTVAHKNITGKKYSTADIQHVKGESSPMTAVRNTPKLPHWNPSTPYRFYAPKSLDLITEEANTGDIELPINIGNDYGQEFAKKMILSDLDRSFFDKLINGKTDIGRLAAPEEMGHAQIGLGHFLPDVLSETLSPESYSLLSKMEEEARKEGKKIDPKEVLKHIRIDNYFTRNNIPTYAQSMAEGAVGINSFRSDAGKYNTQLNYPADYKSYWKAHHVYASREKFDQMLSQVGPMRTNNWQKQMLQLRYIADEEFKRRFGRMPNNDEELPEDILDEALNEWNERGLLRTAQSAQPRMLHSRGIPA